MIAVKRCGGSWSLEGMRRLGRRLYREALCMVQTRLPGSILAGIRRGMKANAAAVRFIRVLAWTGDQLPDSDRMDRNSPTKPVRIDGTATLTCSWQDAVMSLA